MSTPSVTGRITMLRSNPASPKLMTETNSNNDFSDDDEGRLEKAEMNDNKFDEKEGNSSTEEIRFEESTNVEDENGKERKPLFRDSDYETIITELEQFAKSEDKNRWSYICSDSDDDDNDEGDDDDNDEGDDDEIGDERHQDDVKGQELDDSNDSDFYDTDLDDLSPENNRADNDFGDNDYLICRQRYLDACSKFGDAPPQRRILQELEKKTLSVAYRCLTARDIKPLCVALVDNLRVENLNLSHCDVRNEGCMHIAQLLLDNIVISRLNLCSNGISYESMKTLSHALSYNKILQHLDLSGNKLDHKAMFLLAPGLAKNSALLSVNFSNNAFCELSGLTLGAALAENKRLQEIDLSWNQLRGKGTVGILKALEINKTLTSINLAWNGLLYDGSVAVSKCLKSSKILTSLDISHNNINWNGACIISKGLAANTTLQVLKIGNNPLTTTGAMDLMMAVSNDTSNVRLLDMIDVAVLGESELLAIMVMSKRKFQFIHGGVVHSSDVLGQRKEREITAIEKVMSYMKSLGLRPLELLRAFDKSAMISVSQKEFKTRLKKTGVQLFRYEIESLAQNISSRTTGESSGIDYRKLVEEINRQILSERNRKIAERRKREKRREYHRRVLNVELPVEVLSETDDEISRPQTTRSDGSVTMTSRSGIMTRTTSKKSILSLPKIADVQHTRSLQPLQIKQITPTKKPGSTLSMCAPLGYSRKPVKKNVKKKQRKRTNTTTKEEGQSWMSINKTKAG